MTKPNWGPSWRGGRTLVTQAGETRYVIKRTRNGKLYVKTLDVRSEKDAEAELALFERDPESYKTPKEALAERQDAARKAEQGACYIRDHRESFLAYLRKEGRSAGYVRDSDSTLFALEDLLPGNLSEATLADLRRALAKWHTESKKKPITALKSFCSYLEKELGILDPFKNAARLLKTPSPRPEKAVRRKGYTLEHVAKLYRHILQQHDRDVVLWKAKTGMHYTEMARIVAGEGEVTLRPNCGRIAATLRFVHKSGKVATKSIDQQTLEAVQRLVARGYLPEKSNLRRSLDWAAQRAGVDKVNIGSLRHSRTTWLLEAGQEIAPTGQTGLPIQTVANDLGHLNPRTTSLFYAEEEVPTLKVVPGLRLFHRDDPNAVQLELVADRS